MCDVRALAVVCVERTTLALNDKTAAELAQQCLRSSGQSVLHTNLDRYQFDDRQTLDVTQVIRHQNRWRLSNGTITTVRRPVPLFYVIHNYLLFFCFFMFHVTANKSIEQTNQSALCLLEIYIIIGLILRQKDTQQNTIMELVKLNHQNSFNAKHQNGLQLDSDYVVSTTTTTTAMCIVLVINGSSSSSSSFCYHAFWTKHLAACCIETYHFINDAMEMEWKLFFVFFFCLMMRPSAMTKLWAIIIVYREKQCQLFACLFVY